MYIILFFIFLLSSHGKHFPIQRFSVSMPAMATTHCLGLNGVSSGCDGAGQGSANRGSFQWEKECPISRSEGRAWMRLWYLGNRREKNIAESTRKQESLLLCLSFSIFHILLSAGSSPLLLLLLMMMMLLNCLIFHLTLVFLFVLPSVLKGGK